MGLLKSYSQASGVTKQNIPLISHYFLISPLDIGKKSKKEPSHPILGRKPFKGSLPSRTTHLRILGDLGFSGSSPSTLISLWLRGVVSSITITISEESQKLVSCGSYPSIPQIPLEPKEEHLNLTVYVAGLLRDMHITNIVSH